MSRMTRLLALLPDRHVVARVVEQGEGAGGHVTLVAAGRDVEGEGAPPAADIEGRDRPRPQVRGQDRPRVLPGARPVVVAGEAPQGAAVLQQGTEPARLLRQIEVQHVAV